MNRRRQWDIFCRVIDNFGDIGVCWRLACGLAARGQQVRLWTDDASALAWMAPGGHVGVSVQPWPAGAAPPGAGVQYPACDVLVEAFGCDVPPDWLEQFGPAASRSARGMAKSHRLLWINLEYLSAQAYAGRCHGLPSPVQASQATGWRKFFYYPGFTAATGGLLREPDIALRQAAFDRDGWLATQGITVETGNTNHGGEVLVSLFCYEPLALPQLLRGLAEHGMAGRPVRLLVTAGRATAAVQGIINDEKWLFRTSLLHSLLSISYLPLLSQRDYDHLLWAADLNFVRGEDSLVRAIWAGKPFVWQAYPQEDSAHQAKLEAFLVQIAAPASLRAAHHAWNLGPGDAPVDFPPPDLASWGDCARTARNRLAAQDDLCSRLLGFVAESR